MKKILVVTQHFWPEAFRINDLVEGFLQDGYAVDVLCGLPNYPAGEWFDGYRYTGPRKQDYKGATVYRAGEIKRQGNTGLRIFANYVSWPVCACFNLWRLSGGYDAVLCYNTSPVLMSFPAILYAKWHKIPLTNYVLDIWPENLYSVLPVQNKALRRVATAVSDWHYKRADKLVAMSDSLKDRLIQRTGKPSEAVAVIPQHCEDFYAVPLVDDALAERFAGRFNLLFAGNFSPAQSLETVIDAVILAKKQGADTLRLILLGGGMSETALKEYVTIRHAETVVEFWPSVSPAEIPAYTALADGLVAPLCASDDLGMTVPAKIASYMAAAKPILASMDGEGALAVEKAACGFASGAENADALAQNMLRLFHATKDETETMGQNAFAYYQRHYRRRTVLSALENFIV